MTRPQYLDYLNPVNIIWRRGTASDPYVDKVEFLKVVNQKVILTEIPDKFERVRIEGMNEINYEKYNRSNLNPNEYFVDYSNGVVQVHRDQEATTLNISYKGKGLIQYPSERIYHFDKNNNVTESLYDVIENSKANVEDAKNKLEEFQDMKNDVELSINRSKLATNNANQSAERAEKATTLALDAHETTKLVFKEYVNTKADIDTTYPDPNLGWTVQVYDTGIRYRWDGFDWIPIDIFGGAIPLASETIDGLMSTTDYKKLKSFPTSLKDRVIVFVVPSYLTVGVQSIIARFPFSGTIVDARAFCKEQGSAKTELSVEKSTFSDFGNDLNNWSNVFMTNLVIPTGAKVDDATMSLSTTSVGKDDVFRLNVLQTGDIKNTTVELTIRV